MQCVTWGNLLIWVLQLFKYSLPAMWFKQIKNPWIYHNTGGITLFLFACLFVITVVLQKTSWVKNKRPSRQMYASIDWAAVLQDKPAPVWEIAPASGVLLPTASVGLFLTLSSLTLPCSILPFLTHTAPTVPCPGPGSATPCGGSGWSRLCLTGAGCVCLELAVSS